MYFSPAFIFSRILYSAAIFLSLPILNLHLIWRLKKGKEIPGRISERKGIPSIPRPNGEIIWVHAASVGESLSSIPIIECLLKRNSNLSVLLTTGTVTSAKLMYDRLPEGAFHQFVPLDNSNWIQQFLNYWKPSTVIWLESEFWPNTLYIVKKKSIPLILLNGRVSEQSYHRWKKTPWIINGILSCFDICLAQATEDASYLLELGAKHIIYIGNIKLGSPALPVDEKQLSSLSKAMGDRPNWLISSTHEGEEAIAASLHSKLRQQYPNLLTIIVPRHPERGPVIAEQLRSKGFQCRLRTVGELIDNNTDIYIADTMGELGLFYRLCEIVFMGKSLVYPGGGQNPFEAAKLSRAVLFGPYMGNFIELSTAMVKANAAIQVNNKEELQREIEKLLSLPDEIKNRMKNAELFCKESETIIKNAVDEILKLYQKS
mgnify:CR=1 FL=1